MYLSPCPTLYLRAFRLQNNNNKYLVPMFFFLISSLSFRFFSTPPPNHLHCVLLFLNSLEVLGNSFDLLGGGCCKTSKVGPYSGGETSFLFVKMAQIGLTQFLFYINTRKDEIFMKVSSSVILRT